MSAVESLVHDFKDTTSPEERLKKDIRPLARAFWSCVIQDWMVHCPSGGGAVLWVVPVNHTVSIGTNVPSEQPMICTHWRASSLPLPLLLVVRRQIKIPSRTSQPSASTSAYHSNSPQPIDSSKGSFRTRSSESGGLSMKPSWRQHGRLSMPSGMI